MGATLLLGGASTASCPLGRPGLDHQFGDGLSDDGIVNFSRFNSSIEDQVHSTSALRIPFVWFHNGGCFIAFFVVYTTLEVADPMHRPRRIGASAFVH